MPDFKFDDSAPQPPKPSTPPQSEPTEELPGKPSDFQFSLDDVPSTAATPASSTPPAAPSSLPTPTIPGMTPPPAARSQRPAGATPPAAGAAPGTPGASKPAAPASGGAAPGTPQRPGGPPRPSSAPAPAIPLPFPASNLAAYEGDSDIQPSSQNNYSRKVESFGSKVQAILDSLEEPATWVLRVAMVVGITALAYLLAGTILGKAGNLTGNPHAAALVKNLTLASRVFMISLISASVASILLAYEDNRLGFLVGGIGLLFHFLAPLALQKFVGTSAATIAMAPFFRQGGYWMVMIGLVKGLGDTAIWLWNLPEKMKEHHANVGVANQAEAKQRIIAREANMFSPCWKLPFCRESIRKQCPAFLAKTTCWKFGRGCYCDDEMISRIVRGESLDVIKAPTRLSRTGKPPCGRCYIYIEHQTYKFRMISPLALPTAVLATYLAWPVYSRLYMAGNNAVESILGTLSIGSSTKVTPDALKSTADSIEAARQVGNSPEQIAHIAQNMVGALLGFMLLIYISKFIEWAIFKAKW